MACLVGVVAAFVASMFRANGGAVGVTGAFIFANGSNGGKSSIFRFLLTILDGPLVSFSLDSNLNLVVSVGN